jgi:hypothetical protein
LNIKRPELCPYPFKIFPVMNLPGLEASEFHDGFCLVMRNEVQDMGGGTHTVVTKDKSIQKKKVKQFKFKAWVSGPQ